VAALATKVVVIFHPYKGTDFRVTFYVAAGVVDPSDAGIQAVIAAINGVTRAVAIQIEVSAASGITATASTTGAYISEDKAQFNFSDESSHAHIYKVPGLKPVILLADTETIDPAGTGVPTFTAAILANARGRGGADVTTLVSAHRTENRKRLKSGPRT
jgi:hypothetical protein